MLPTIRLQRCCPPLDSDKPPPGLASASLQEGDIGDTQPVGHIPFSGLKAVKRGPRTVMTYTLFMHLQCKRSTPYPSSRRDRKFCRSLSDTTLRRRAPKTSEEGRQGGREEGKTAVNLLVN